MALNPGSPDTAGELRGTGFWTRLRIGFVVLLNVVLATAAAVALTWLATRPGLRQRFDLTAAGQNTLDVATRGVLDNLPGDEPIAIDVFFRPEAQPLTRIVMQAQERMLHLLLLAQEYRPELVAVRDHQLSPDPARSAEVEARRRELGVQDVNVLVFSRGERRQVVRLYGEVAEIDLGNPDRRPGFYRPPSLIAFRGEEALVKALLEVTKGASPKLLFSWGQGERDLYGATERDMGDLHGALVDEGFDVGRWVPDEDGPLPADCEVLAVIGPQEPFTDAEAEWILDFVARGGSLIAAPAAASDEPGSLSSILARHGVLVGEGVEARPYVDQYNEVRYGDDRCASFILRAGQMQARHPITMPLRLGDRRVLLYFARPLRRGSPPPGAALLDLLRSDQYSWEDREPNNWMHEEGEDPGPHALAMTSVSTPEAVGPALPLPGEVGQRPEARVLAIASPDTFRSDLFRSNRDFLVNAFNWAASRDYRVSISTRDPDLRVLPLGEGRSLFVVNLVATWILPASCLLLGLFTAWRRRR